MKLATAREAACLSAIADICVSFLAFDRPPKKEDWVLILALLQSLGAPLGSMADTLRFKITTRPKHLDAHSAFQTLRSITAHGDRIALLRELYKLSLSFPDRLSASEGTLLTGAFYFGLSRHEFETLRDEIKKNHLPVRSRLVP